jgi:hypothetical protein
MDRREQENTMPPLGDAESTRVDRPICPPVAQVFKGSHNVIDHGTPVELQHERYILKEHPRRSILPEHSKNVGYHRRFLAIQPLSSPHLRQILARESSSKQVNIPRNGLDLRNIRDEEPPLEPLAQNGLCSGVVLAKEHRLVASPL